jgi:serine/threonine protein kinase
MSWQIEGWLGEGSQGSVYKASKQDAQSQLKHTVAIKILHSETAVDSWKQEFESLTKIRSPHCVHALGFERVDGRPAIVMEYVEGLDLTYLVSRGLLNAELSGEVIAQVERGLLDLHEQGLAHGDLSPRNVLIAGDGTVKLLDYGLANAQRWTPEFTPPEWTVSVTNAGLGYDLFALHRLAEIMGVRYGDRSWDIEPKQRQPEHRRSNPEHRVALAHQVTESMQQRALCLQASTQSSKDPRRSQHAPWLGCLLVLIGLLWLPDSSGLTTGSGPRGNAWLEIRSTAWTHISINGKSMGYAPVMYSAKPGERVLVRWQSALGKGERTLRLSAGQRLRIQDSDLSH